MEFSFTPKEQAFRRELHDYLQSEVPEWFAGIFALPEGEHDKVWEFTTQFARKLAKKGLLIRSWPKEYGGQEATHMEQLILAEEMAYFDEPRGSHYLGANWVGPVIMAFGTEEQKRKHLPAIANAEVLWCQGFSEPNAGSDLASLKTQATVDGDEYIINGQKIWTSYADHAGWCLIGVRTDTAAPKHKGITYLLMDMKTPGITVHPIRSIFGLHFCEVFLDNVRVPTQNTLGERNRGWYVMMQSMEYERGGYIKYARCQRTLDEIVKYVKETSVKGKLLIDDPLIRNKLADMAIGIRAVRALTHHMYWMQSQRLTAGYHPSVVKMASSEFDQNFTNIAMQILGLYGRLSKDSKYTRLKGRIVREYIWSREGTVAGGTSEIQRNVIASGLGLPKE